MPTDNELLSVFAIRMYNLLIRLEDHVDALEGTNKENETLVDDYHELMEEIVDSGLGESE